MFVSAGYPKYSGGAEVLPNYPVQVVEIVPLRVFRPCGAGVAGVLIAYIDQKVIEYRPHTMHSCPGNVSV
jgi:hypothetical protein